MSRSVPYETAGRPLRPLPGPPSKALLVRLAERVGVRPIELYKSFLSDCTSANHAPNAVAVLEEGLAARYYGAPEEEPRYFSLAKANDLSFLRLVSGVTFVVYQEHTSFGLQRIFDNRVQLCASLGGVDPPSALVFLLKPLGVEGHRLFEVKAGENHFDPSALQALASRVSEKDSDPVPVGACLLSALARLLGVRLDPGTSKWSLAEVLQEPVAVWEALRKPFALAEYVGVAPWSHKQRNADRACRQKFKIMLTVYDRLSHGLVPWDSVRLVCLDYQGFLFLVDKANTERVLGERTRDLAARPGEKLEPFPSLAKPGSQEYQDEQTFKALSAPAPNPLVDHRKLTPCDCELCRECSKYQDNLERCGSQGLYTVDWDLFTYLKVLDLDSEDNLGAVREALRLSVSGMDLETSTVSLSSEQAPLGSGGFEAPHEKITAQPRQGGDHELAERILLIGHIDNQEGESAEVEMFEAGRSPAGVRDVVHKYVRYVCVRQRKMELRKRLLLRPLLEFASRHREAHLSCLESNGVDPATAAGSWKFSLLGRFEQRVEKLCRKYYVYAFNGSGFDFPLLCGHISTAPWMRRQWSIQRNGSSVTMMSMGGRCIYFRGELPNVFF